MYICICNPFTDKDVTNHLAVSGVKTSVKSVYTACSDGEEMNCGNCACELKSIVDQHNNTLTIEHINDQMEKITAKEKETVE